MSTARAAALKLLTAVTDKGRALDDAWAEDLKDGALTGLDTRDRAFARALVATTLRRLGQIDAILDAKLNRPLPDKAVRTRNILRTGIAQTVFLRTADHAAVNEAVGMAAGARQSLKHKDMVNAILRAAAREAATLAESGDWERANTPDWLWESWTRAYGEDTARAIARAHLADPPLDLTVRADPETWGPRLEAMLLPTGTLRRGLTDVTTLPGFEEGAWWVQDAAAALPVTLLGAVNGQSVIDLCAAPGGKTAQLAAKGAQVIAIDRSKTRLTRVTGNLARLGLTADLVCADATQWRPQQPADAVLLDAPCSATGTIRRHPDVAHLKSPEDVAALAALQTRLLDQVPAMLKPGGVMVYCTCSLQPEEGPDQIAAFLERTPGWTIEPVRSDEIGGLAEAITPDGTLRTLPCHWPESGGLDGFFAARLRAPA